TWCSGGCAPAVPLGAITPVAVSPVRVAVRIGTALQNAIFEFYYEDAGTAPECPVRLPHRGERDVEFGQTAQDEGRLVAVATLARRAVHVRVDGDLGHPV